MTPLSRAWLRLGDRVLAELGVSSSSGWALVHLRRIGNDTRQADLARAIGITEASLVRTLHQLEGAGKIVRVADPTDRRANRLRLTPEGRTLAAEIDDRLIALRSELLSGISSADLEGVARVFDLVATRIAGRLGGP